MTITQFTDEDIEVNIFNKQQKLGHKLDLFLNSYPLYTIDHLALWKCKKHKRNSPSLGSFTDEEKNQH